MEVEAPTPLAGLEYQASPGSSYLESDPAPTCSQYSMGRKISTALASWGGIT